MTYLVDANILSEPTKPAPDPKVVEWLIANEGDFVVDSIILGELLVGILMLPAAASAPDWSSGSRLWCKQSTASRGTPQ